MSEVDRLAKIIWDYMLLYHELQPADVILILGSHDLRVAEKAADLFLKGYGKYVVCTGGYGEKESFFEKPEAEVFAKVLLEKKVPRENILIENQSKNTGENISFAKKILTSNGVEVQSLICVQKPYMERRSFATLSKQWPEALCMVTSPDIPFESYANNPLDKKKFIEIMVGDLQRIKEYPARGFQIAQEIPDAVLGAYQNLVALGYTRYLLSV